MNHQFVKLICRITEIKGKSAYTQFEGFEFTREYIRRNVRRRRSIITATVDTKSKDNVKVQFTAYTFTARKIDTSKKDAIRTAMIQTVEKAAKGNNFVDLVSKALYGNLSNDIFKNVKHVAPVKRVEIAKCEVLRGK
jgi:small subunit ribosomal protein S3Ae